MAAKNLWDLSPEQWKHERIRPRKEISERYRASHKYHFVHKSPNEQLRANNPGVEHVMELKGPGLWEETWKYRDHGPGPMVEMADLKSLN